MDIKLVFRGEGDKDKEIMSNHKHEWRLLMPLANEIDIKDKVLYGVDVAIRKTVGTGFYCSVCLKVAYKIKSHRSGMRLANQPEYLITRANEMRTKYGIEPISLTI